ncbi:MAG: type II toxin-antitoxin system HicA family toxin [Candidatus Neomarinimicrobiota bacterium]
MSRLPGVTGKQLVATLKRLGFEVVRTRGSHYYLRHPDGRATVVPVHRGETIRRGLMAKILRDTEITREELQAYL